MKKGHRLQREIMGCTCYTGRSLGGKEGHRGGVKGRKERHGVHMEVMMCTGRSCGGKGSHVVQREFMGCKGRSCGAKGGQGLERLKVQLNKVNSATSLYCPSFPSVFFFTCHHMISLCTS